MDKKSKIILILLVITLLSLSSYASLSRFSKGINKEGSIQTTEMEYCKLNEIDSFSECLIRNDSKQELSLALNTIDDRTSRLDLSKIEPTALYIPTVNYVDIVDKTSSEAIISSTSALYNYVVESKLIDPLDENDLQLTNLSFNQETGHYIFKNYLVGNNYDIVTTEEDMANGIYKYTCFNTMYNGDCEKLYLFTENPYLIYDQYRFKQGYVYSYELTDTTSRNAGLYKGEDDYTTNDSNYTYYYRGDINNNWVKFGNSLWRIIRINGNGTIRLIYSGLESSTHTGTDAQADKANYSYGKEFRKSIPDITGLSNNPITLTYYTGRYGGTYVGYMYSPHKNVLLYQDKTLGNTNRLNTFPLFTNMSSTQPFYFFKNFNPEEDCYLGDGEDDNSVCILKCQKLGNDGDEGVDCVSSIWNTLATTEGNYSTTAPGVYPENNPTMYVYTSEYKYTCWGIGDSYKKTNSDGTTSVYVACSNVSEIVGTIKNQPTWARIKYYNLTANTKEESNANILDSRIKEKVDAWYQSNILNEKDENNNYLEEYLSDGIFCNDRSSKDTAYPMLTFSPAVRGTNNVDVSFKCLNIDGTFNTNDAFTLKTSDTESRVEASGIGNNMLKYPVGLITIDEVSFAGGKRSTINNKFYLYTGTNYWTMSPNSFGENHLYAFQYTVTSSGSIYNYPTIHSYGVRPVINLKSDILYKSGNGTETNPYIIDVNN